jgi:hypothetical protein
VSQSDFILLTRIPINICYGDNIADTQSVNPGQEQWRIFFETAKRWRDVVNHHGGDVTVVQLPEIGIWGNTHFPMSDLNNLQISKFLSEKKTGLKDFRLLNLPSIGDFRIGYASGKLPYNRLSGQVMIAAN